MVRFINAVSAIVTVIDSTNRTVMAGLVRQPRHAALHARLCYWAAAISAEISSLKSVGSCWASDSSLLREVVRARRERRSSWQCMSRTCLPTLRPAFVRVG